MAAPLIKIYTDGSCSPNPGPGGWAAVLLFNAGKKVVELSGAESETTNNRMELMAAIKALEALETRSEVEVLTDSRYLQRGITEWLDGWQRNAWVTREGQPVKNKDLWKTISQQLRKHKIRWSWVKGHSHDKWNRRADELAVAARAEQTECLKKPEGINLFLGVTWKNTLKSGSWAVILTYLKHHKILGGAEKNTTANRLYLTAVVNGLLALKSNLPVNIYTRSGYLRDGMQTWMYAWQKRNWCTSEGNEVINKKQWQELIKLTQNYQINIISLPQIEPPCYSQEVKELAREFEHLQ